nr:MAG TPA: hypothetical protein [Caudoviricetes sp.]
MLANARGSRATDPPRTFAAGLPARPAVTAL